MRGAWIARLGARVLHADTFALMLSPAVADLQFEAPAEGVTHPAQYLGVVRAFAGAFWFDFSTDLLSLAADIPMIGVLTAIQAAYYSFMLVLLSGLGTGTLLEIDATSFIRALDYLLAITMASTLTSSACFWPPRRAAAGLGTD